MNDHVFEGTLSASATSGKKERLLPQIPIANFLKKLAEILPRLVEFVSSQTLREHPVWGQAIPYHIPFYGTGTSLGHCIRPDILLTTDGPKICELDFVPSGRGYLLAGLDEAQQKETLNVFAEWYRRMGASKVLYATATTTVCREETELFSEKLRECCGIDISAVNIDAVSDTELAGAFIDRLSYRSEMNNPDEARKNLTGLTVATAEPYLDSKAIFAMVHDDSLAKALEATLGKEELSFLRKAFPQTTLVRRIKEKELPRLATERSKWVLKNSDVETNSSWGCRGTVVGRNYNESKFLGALRGEPLNGKDVGMNPILQRWYSSRDFWQVWNAVVKGVFQRTALVQHGREHHPKTFCEASDEVGARIGFYFLVVRKTGDCLVTPYGDLVLRQDHLIHGASDAICLPVEAYD